jgi:hypothetical protein
MSVAHPVFSLAEADAKHQMTVVPGYPVWPRRRQLSRRKSGWGSVTPTLPRRKCVHLGCTNAEQMLQ